MIVSDAYTHRTYSMGLVDENNKVNYYGGWLGLLIPMGMNLLNLNKDYLEHIAEHVEPWSYIKFPYLKRWDERLC